MNKLEKLISNLSEEIDPHIYEKIILNEKLGFDEIVVWKRKSFNINSAIVLIKLDEKDNNEVKSLGKYSKSIKKELGKIIKFTPCFYELGLQIIYYGEDIIDLSYDLNKYVDKINTFTVILQSIHVIDIKNNKSKSVRTWGQIVTGKYQDMIERNIDFILNA